MKAPVLWANSLIALFWFFCLLPGHCDEKQGKKYRDFVVRHEIRNGQVIDKTTKLLPQDERFLSGLEKIGKDPFKKGDQPFLNVLKIIEQTDSSLVVVKCLILLRQVPDLPISVIRKIHLLALTGNIDIMTHLSFVLAWAGYPESVSTLTFLAQNQDGRVKDTAIQMLCYFGIEAISAFPFINSIDLKGFNGFYLAKILRHFFFIAFIAGGQQILPSDKTIRQEKGLQQPRLFDQDIISLPSLHERLWAK